MQKTLEEIKILISKTDPREAVKITRFLESKLAWLKVCYEKSDSHFKRGLLDLIKYEQLKCFLTEQPYSNSYKTKKIELQDIVYTTKSIKNHINIELPKTKQSIDIYSFYFGGYRDLFNVFTIEFLKKIFKGKVNEEFLNEILSARKPETDSINDQENFVEENLSDSGFPKQLTSIPYLEIKNCIPRVSILESIFNLFQQGNKKINITGTSGVGKTFIAKHYVHHYLKTFSHIVWLNCSAGFIKAFSTGKGFDLLHSLKIDSEGTKNEEGLMRKVLGQLKQLTGNNLLILDNLDEEVQYYEDEIHLSDNWKILATSQGTLHGFHNFKAPYFDKEAFDLFYKYYTIEKDDENLNHILSTIEYHTLTVELLSKTAQQRKIRIADLLERFIEKGINVVVKTEVITDHSRERSLTIENIENYLAIIFDTSHLSADEFKILVNVALFQSQDISEKVFQGVFLCGNKDREEIERLQADIEILSRKGWLNQSGDCLHIHGLVKGLLLKKKEDKLPLFSDSITYLGNRLDIVVLEDFEKGIEYFTLCEGLILNTQGSFRSLVKNVAKPFSSFYNHFGFHEDAYKIFHIYFFDELKEKDEIELIEIYFEFAERMFLVGKHKEALDLAIVVNNFFIVNSDPLINIESSSTRFNELCNAEFTEFDDERNEIDKKQINLIHKNISLFLRSSRLTGILLSKSDSLDKGKETIVFGLSYHEKLVIDLVVLTKNGNNHSIVSKLKYEECLNNAVLTITNLAELYVLGEDDDMAFHYFNKAFELQSEISRPYIKNTRLLFKNLADFYIRKADLNKSMHFILKMLNPSNVIDIESGKELIRLQDSLTDLMRKNKKLDIFEPAPKSLTQTMREAFDILEHQSKNDTDLVNYYETMHSIYFQFKFYDKAILCLEKKIKVLKYSNEKDKDIEVAKSYFSLANCCLVSQRPKLGLIHFERMTGTIPKNSHQTEVPSSSISVMEELLFDLLDKVDSVNNKLAEKLHAILKSVNSNQQKNTKLVDLLLDETLASFTETISTFLESHENKSIKPDYGILIYCHEMIADFYFEVFFYDRAITIKQRQLEIMNHFFDDDQIVFVAETCQSLAIFHSAVAQYELAYKYINQAIETYTQETTNEGLINNAFWIRKKIEDELDKFKT